MENRLNLQTTFEDILGSRSVYFQPPESIKLSYPAIIYSLSDIEITFASNGKYRKLPVYEVTLIDRNPDSEFLEKLLDLPYCEFDRVYQSDNLNHFTFTIYNVKGGNSHEDDLGSDW